MRVPSSVALTCIFMVAATSVPWEGEGGKDDRESEQAKIDIARPVRVPQVSLSLVDFLKAVLLVVSCC